MKRLVWFARWHASRALIHFGLMVAPRGPARTLLVRYLNDFGREVTSKIKVSP